MNDRNQISAVIASRLRSLRSKAGPDGAKLSYAKLREALMDTTGIEISSDSLKNYEAPSTNHTKSEKNLGMSIETLRAFSQFYGVSADYLLGLTDVTTPSTNARAIIQQTGLSEDNTLRLLAFAKSKSDGSCASAEAYGIPSRPGETINHILGELGIGIANDIISAFVADNRILIGYMELLAASAKQANQSSEDVVHNAACAASTEIPGYEPITRGEYIRFQASQVAHAFESFLVKQYLKEDTDGND